MKRFVFAIACVVLAGIAVAPALAADGGYLAYAVTKKGEFPLPEQIDGIDSKQLSTMKWGDYAGPQLRVAVMEVDNNSNTSSFKVSGPNGQTYSYESVDFNQQVPVNGIEAMVTDVLQRSGRFRLVERKELGNVLDEQDLAASGRVAKPSGAKTGNVLGAQYLIQAVVTSYEPNVSSKKGGLGGITRGFLGGAKVGKNKSAVGMNFRLIDAETSEILFTRQVDVMNSSFEFSGGGVGWGSAGALGGFLSSYSKTPIGQTVMAAVNIGTYDLVKQLGNSPAEGSVIKADGDGVYVNLGEDVVQPGDTLKAMSKGEELIDPDTGLSLGGEDEEIGTLKVTEVKDKFSIAEPVGFDVAKLKRGDKVVSTKQAAPMSFAPSWTGPGKDEND